MTRVASFLLSCMAAAILVLGGCGFAIAENGTDTAVSAGNSASGPADKQAMQHVQEESAGNEYRSPVQDTVRDKTPESSGANSVEQGSASSQAQKVAAGESSGETAKSLSTQHSSNTVNTTTDSTGLLDSEATQFGWGSYIQAIGVLFLLLGILYLALWVFKRYGRLRRLGNRFGAERALELEEQFHFGPKKSLVVVRFLDKRLLLGVTDQQITLLSENEANHEPQQSDFKHVMDSTRGEDS